MPSIEALYGYSNAVVVHWLNNDIGLKINALRNTPLKTHRENKEQQELEHLEAAVKMGMLWPNTKDSNSAESITYAAFQDHLSSYESHIPSKLQELDILRFEGIPGLLAQRRKGGNAFLEKTDVTTLVEWKLKHGIYRPNLANLVASNSTVDMRETTKSAFEIYDADNNECANSITALSKLKGIGPATASLLLSCHDPLKVPFFSNELFKYVIWERRRGHGWDRKIKYSMDEYSEMFERATALRERLKKESGKSISMTDIEKVAYVLGKEANSGYKSSRDKSGGDNAIQANEPKRLKTTKHTDSRES